MEAVDGELQKVAKAQDLVFDVLRLVAQSMCFSEAQKASLRAGPVRQKVDMMLGSSEFAPYRQAALSVEAVKRRVEMVQRSALTLRRRGRSSSSGSAIRSAKPELMGEAHADPGGGGPARGRRGHVARGRGGHDHGEAQVDAACQADPTAGEKLRGVREGVAFGEIREAASSSGWSTRRPRR